MGYQTQVWGVFVGKGCRSLWRLVVVASRKGQAQMACREARKSGGQSRAVPLGNCPGMDDLLRYERGVWAARLDELCARHQQSKEEEAVYVRRTQGLTQEELLRRCRKLAGRRKGANA
jgi:hypothetical protein